ncbi:MAG TPA: hypothetical protein VFY58_11660 [Nocardioides sp.]|nr:hypothetical protein [Nocardioides sp.]
MYDTLESSARHQIHERVNRAAEPRIPQVAHRHRLAERLRRIADRIDH